VLPPVVMAIQMHSRNGNAQDAEIRLGRAPLSVLSKINQMDRTEYVLIRTNARNDSCFRLRTVTRMLHVRER